MAKVHCTCLNITHVNMWDLIIAQEMRICGQRFANRIRRGRRREIKQYEEGPKNYENNHHHLSQGLEWLYQASLYIDQKSPSTAGVALYYAQSSKFTESIWIVDNSYLFPIRVSAESLIDQYLIARRPGKGKKRGTWRIFTGQREKGQNWSFLGKPSQFMLGQQGQSKLEFWHTIKNYGPTSWFKIFKNVRELIQYFN